MRDDKLTQLVEGLLTVVTDRFGEEEVKNPNREFSSSLAEDFTSIIQSVIPTTHSPYNFDTLRQLVQFHEQAESREAPYEIAYYPRSEHFEVKLREEGNATITKNHDSLFMAVMGVNYIHKYVCLGQKKNDGQNEF